MARCRPVSTPRPLDRDLLLSVSHFVERGAALGGSDCFVSVTPSGREVAFGFYPLYTGLHPCEELGDMVADHSWWAVGLILHGRGHFLDQPDQPAEPIVSTYFIERGGAEVSLLRRGKRLEEMPGPAIGRIPDLCRSMLGLT
jgi:hypothetical protein